MVELTPIDNLAGAAVYDKSGHHIGLIAMTYVDVVTGAPTYVAISSGDSHAPELVAPFQDARLADREIRLAFHKAEIATTPRIAPGRRLRTADKIRLDVHYGLNGS